jgi:hypothetical protein
MYFTGTFGIKKRLKYGIPIILLIMVIQVLVMTPVTFNSPGVLKGESPGDTSFYINISPYNGDHNSYAVNATFYGLNESHLYKPYFILYSSSTFLNVTQDVNLTNITTSNGIINTHYNFQNVKGGDYYVEVTLNYTSPSPGGNVTTGFVRGPIDYSESAFVLSLFLNYTLLYLILFIMYIAFIFVGRSMGKSSRKVMKRY